MIGEIVSIEAKTGRVMVSFASTATNLLLPVYDMSLAGQGIDVELGETFSATLNSGEPNHEMIRVGGLTAIVQLEAYDALESLLV